MKINRPNSPQPHPKDARLVFKGKIFETYQWDQKLYDGSYAIFEKIKRPDTVVVFPVLEDGSILLTEQEQPGKPKFIGGCGGRIEEGEDVLQAAKRECLEETGYEAAEWILWKAEHPASKIDWVVYFFIAKGCRKSGKQNLDGGEKIELKHVSFDEFLQIGRDRRFMEKEIIPDLYEALLDPVKYSELKKLFAPLS